MSFKFDVGPLSDETREIAERELRETPENVRKGLDELREFLANDPKLQFDTDEDFLLIFLRPCKFYAKSAYELMKRIADFKEKYKPLVRNLMPDDVMDLIRNCNLVNALKNRDQKGRRVLIQYGGGAWNPSEVSADQLFQLVYVMHALAIIEPETQVRGAVVILDFEGLTTKQIMASSPAVMSRLFNYIQDAMPGRIKEIHIVKQPFIFNVLWTIMKNFMSDKVKKRTFFHGSKMTSLHTHLAPSHLPKDFGGDLPEIDHTLAALTDLIGDHIEHMRKMNECGYVNNVV